MKILSRWNKKKNILFSVGTPLILTGWHFNLLLLEIFLLLFCYSSLHLNFILYLFLFYPPCRIIFKLLYFFLIFFFFFFSCNKKTNRKSFYFLFLLLLVLFDFKSRDKLKAIEYYYTFSLFIVILSNCCLYYNFLLFFFVQ